MKDILSSIPELGSVWQHKKGAIYLVLFISNQATNRPDEYPVTVFYRRLNDLTEWSRSLAKWHDSMKEIYLYC